MKQPRLLSGTSEEMPNDAFKKLSKAKEISEDDMGNLEDDIQKMTDTFITKVDKAVEAKTKEVLTV